MIASATFASAMLRARRNGELRRCCAQSTESRSILTALRGGTTTMSSSTGAKSSRTTICGAEARRIHARRRTSAHERSAGEPINRHSRGPTAVQSN
jgi:hypothetical protein